MAYLLLLFVSFSAFLLEMLLIRTIFAVYTGGLTSPIVAFSSFGFALGSLGFYFMRNPGRRNWAIAASIGLSIMAVFYILIFFVLNGGMLVASEAGLPLLFVFLAAFFAGPGFYAAFVFSLDQHKGARAYASDLLGACLGSVLSLFALEYMGRGPTALAVLISILVALVLVSFRLGKWFSIIVLPVCILVGIFSARIFMWPLACAQGGEPFSSSGYHSSSLVELNWKSGPVDLVLRSGRVKVEERDRRAVRSAYLARLDCRGLTMTVDYDDKSVLKHLRQEVHSLPFLLRPVRSAAFFGTGLGMDLVRADYFNVKESHAFEINPFLIKLEHQLLGSRSHYDRANVHLVIGDSRRQVTISPQRYDLIYISSSKNYGRVGVSPSAILLNRQLTMEALEAYWDHLTDDGILFAVDERRHALELSANLEALLSHRGANGPGHAVLVVGGDYAGYLISKKSLSESQMQVLASHAADYNWRLKFDDLTSLRGRATVTDDRPNFHNRFLHEYRSAGASWFKIIIALVLLLLPAILLLPWYRSERGAGGISISMFNFLLIGVTFTSTQIAFLYGLELLFENPTYTVVMTITLMLAGASLGALASKRIKKGQAAWVPALIAVMLLLLNLYSDSFVHYAYIQSLAVRLFAACTVILPVSFLMGFIFPFHMDRLPERATRWIPIFLGMNGIGTLIGAIVATIVISDAGISAIYLQNSVCMVILAAAMALNTSARWGQDH